MSDLVAAEIVKADKLCSFELEDGRKCHDPKHFARGFCERHYRALARLGTFKTNPLRKPTKPDALLVNAATVKRARRKLVKAMPDVVDAFIRGMHNQANSGKTDAAQWAILHTQTLAPVATEKTAPSANGVTVNIGVKVSGTETDK